MQLQVELYNVNKQESKVYWLDVCCENNPMFQPGRRLVLVEEPLKSWTIVRTLLTLPNDAELPPKARKANIFCMFEEDGEAEVRACFPQIFVR